MEGLFSQSAIPFSHWMSFVNDIAPQTCSLRQYDVHIIDRGPQPRPRNISGCDDPLFEQLTNQMQSSCALRLRRQGASPAAELPPEIAPASGGPIMQASHAQHIDLEKQQRGFRLPAVVILRSAFCADIRSNSRRIPNPMAVVRSVPVRRWGDNFRQASTLMD